MPFFSVIIPLYNKENYIEATLKSALNQNFTDYEIIIVNDGSTDNSVAKVKPFLNNNVHLLEQENSGVSVARNLAIKKSSGLHIAFLDADDLWYPNHLYELHKLVLDFPKSGLYCSRYLRKSVTNKLLNNSFSYSFPDNFRGIVSNFFEASMYNRVAQTSAIAVSRKIFNDNYYLFNPEVTSGQDTELWIKIALHYPVAITNQVTAVYCAEVPKSLFKTPITQKKLINFKQFQEHEKTNPSLKQFLDIHRIEYALRFKMAGKKQISNAYFKAVRTKIPVHTKILLKLPKGLLNILAYCKQALKAIGIDLKMYY